MCRKAKLSYKEGLQILKDVDKTLYLVVVLRFLIKKSVIKFVKINDPGTVAEIHETSHSIGMHQCNYSLWAL